MNFCPRDHQNLASNDVNGYRYYSCEVCGGSWIPGASLDRVLSASGVRELHAVRPAGAGEMFCPGCHALCDVLAIEGCRFDFCPRCHGVWLDAGEAKRVQHLFPEGSALVDADTAQQPGGDGAGSLTEFVGSLFLKRPR